MCALCAALPLLWVTCCTWVREAARPTWSWVPHGTTQSYMPWTRQALSLFNLPNLDLKIGNGAKHQPQTWLPLGQVRVFLRVAVRGLLGGRRGARTPLG